MTSNCQNGRDPKGPLFHGGFKSAKEDFAHAFGARARLQAGVNVVEERPGTWWKSGQARGGRAGLQASASYFAGEACNTL
jgi:hypothetical protein